MTPEKRRRQDWIVQDRARAAVLIGSGFGVFAWVVFDKTVIGALLAVGVGAAVGPGMVWVVGRQVRLRGTRGHPFPSSPQWMKDPFGRRDLRWWDGSDWTEHVSTAGSQSTDPPD
jgi:hypothetical protein